MRLRLGWVALFVMTAGFAPYGCGGSDGSSTDPNLADGGGQGGDAADAGSNADAPWGLDDLAPNTTCVAKTRPPSPAAITLVSAYPNLTFENPVGMFQAPGDSSTWYVVEQGGTITSFASSPSTTAVTDDFLATPLTVDLGATFEGGLLGFAFHPGYATNGTAFLAYTIRGASGLTQKLARFKKNGGGKLAFDAELISRDPPAGSVREEHNWGSLVFGTDGHLYVGLGDGYVPGDNEAPAPLNPAQDPASLFGKILRIAVGPTGSYTIPDGNPYKAGGGAGEVFARGFRNPWRFSFDRDKPTDLWVADVGDDLWEEIDKVELGKNYGWSVMEGGHCYGGIVNCNNAGMVPPIVEYTHTGGLVAVIGGFVYRGTQYPSLLGKYFYADFSGRIWSLPNGAGPAVVELDTGFPIATFAEGNDGELYVVSYDYGTSPAKVYKITATPPDDSNFPKTLSATGCVDPADATKPAPGLVPFDVNSPLWSDGAEKHRWMALPQGTKVHVQPDGHFEFPVGTVLMKEFRIDGKRVETRLFMRHQDGDWGGYSYEWNDQGTDATLLPNEKAKTVGAQTWTYPSRGQCFSCHTNVAGRSLGPELGQLNGAFTYEATGRTANQLVTLDHLQLLDVPIGDVAAQPRLPSPGGADPLEARARAYLHANCAFCHRPGGPGQGPHNLLFSADFKAMSACNVVPTQGDLGKADAKIVFPGDPAKSILSLRMHATDGSRMPPLGTRVVDTAGTSVIDSWITGLTACP